MRGRATKHVRRWTGARAAALAAAVVALTFAAGCGGSSSSGDGGSSNGGVKDADLVRIGTTNTVDSTNPFVGVALLSVEFNHQMYPYLMAFDSKAVVQPDFASSWKMSDNFKKITLDLKTGGKWSDGQPLTAKDAAFTFNTMIKYASGAAATLALYTPTLKTATAPDDHTLVLTFSSPSPTVPGQLTYVPILPEHVYGKYATGDGSGLKKFQNDAPTVGGGPFSLAKYVPKQVAIFDRNPGYYGSKPHVARLGYTTYSSSDAMVNALKSSEIDAAEIVPPSTLESLSGPDFTVQNPTSFSEEWFNINDSKASKQHLELHDLAVRKALDMAIDRERIVKTAYFGSALPGGSLVPPSLPHYHLNVDAPAFDIAGANAVLDKAGYKMGPNGVRLANGKPMEYTFLEIKSGPGPDDSAAAIMKSDFAKIGIKINVSPVDIPAGLTALMGPKKDYSTFDMMMVTYIGGYDPDAFLGSPTCGSLPSFNPSGRCDKAYDTLRTKFNSLPDGAARAAVGNQLQQMLLDDRSTMVVAYSQDIYVYRKGWTGFVASPSGWFFGTETAAQLGKTG
jgi:peptide/nickel transport system substrate-binding protein